MAYRDEIDADSPSGVCSFELNGSLGGTLSYANGTPTWQQTGQLGANEAAALPSTCGLWDTVGQGTALQGGAAWTVEMLVKAPNPLANLVLFYLQPKYTDPVSCLQLSSAGHVRMFDGGNWATSISGLFAADDWILVAASYDGVGTLSVWMNGIVVGTSSVSPSSMTTLFGDGSYNATYGPSSPMIYINRYHDSTTTGYQPNGTFVSAITIDEYSRFGSELSSTRMAAHASAASVTPPSVPDTYSPTLPISWEIQDTYAPYLPIVWNMRDVHAPSLPISWDIKNTYAPSLPIRWEFPEVYSPSLPIRWSIIDATHFSGTVANWGLAVAVGTTDISAQLVRSADIQAEETASTIANLQFLPATGSVDPETFENQSLTIDFVGRDSADATIYVARRFTGLVSRAVYDAASGVMSLAGTTDLQGRLEAMERDTIDNLIGSAYWSRNVFDSTADGWQYALDRLSTRPAEINIDPHGVLVVNDWEAGSVDITFTDSTRFDDTLALERVRRRDLLNRLRIDFDFRFTRLRQREINMRIIYTGNVCQFLIRPFNVLQRAQVEGVADRGEWVRLGDITYDPFYPPNTYLCNNPPGPFFPVVWVAAGVDMSGICLGASWRAGRRWAQTITETATVEVTASDSITAVGEFGLSEDYGLEAPYDSSAWESQDFDGIKSGASVNSAQDYVFDADQAAIKGRDDYEAAQTCAIAKAKTEILSRHRANRVRFSPVYRPDISLGHTIRVNSTYLQSTGKVFSYVERFDFDSGNLDLDLTLAVSRHGGSGLAADDPLDPADQPDAPEETPPKRTHTFGYYIGGDPDSPAQDDEWRGFITNRQVPQDPTKTYVEGLNIEYPQIEDTARDAVAVTATKTIDVAIPLDELTMSA